jgi:hypothetical protein
LIIRVFWFILYLLDKHLTNHFNLPLIWGQEQLLWDFKNRIENPRAPTLRGS